jgi:hypothetical protein
MNLLFIYVGVVIAAGAGLLANFGPAAYPSATLVATLTAAMLVVSYFKLRLPLAHGSSTISMAFAVDFVALLTVGADVAMIIAAAGVLVQCCTHVRRQRPFYRTAFSVATVVISVQAAGLVWNAFGGSINELSIATTVVPLALTTVAYFAVQAGLVAVAITLASNGAAVHDVQPFLAAAPGYVLAAILATAVTVMVQQQEYTLVPVFAVPMLACHLAYAAVFQQMAARLAGAPQAAAI